MENEILIYNKIEGIYDESHEQYSDYLQDRVITNLITPLWKKNIGDTKGKVILDLGCGEGTDLLNLSRQSPSKLVGADLSSEMLKIAEDKLKNFPHFRGIKGNFSDDKFWEELNEEFDLVYTKWGHLYLPTREELLKFFKNIYKILKPNGKFLLISTNYYGGNDKLFDLIAERYEPIDSEEKDGGQIKVTLSSGFVLYCYRWNDPVIRELMQQAGFRNVIMDFDYEEDVSSNAYSKEEMKRLKESSAIYALHGLKQIMAN